MNWYALKEEEVLRELNVDFSRGLTSAEAADRLLKYGPNEIKAEKGISAIGIFLRQFNNVLIIILIIAAVISGLVGEILDAELILIIVLFSAGLGFLQEYRAEKAVKALKKMLSPTSTVIRDGREVEIPTKELVPGDVLILEAGDRVPADARIYEAYALKVDESSLTGESVPVEKYIGVLKTETEISERKNMLFSGTVISYGRGKALVVATGMNTELGKIAFEVGRIEEEKTPLERRTEEIGKWFGIIAFTICFAVAGIGVLRELTIGSLTFEFLLNMMMFAVALAVAAVPEALAGIVTGTLAIGMNEMAKKNAIVRRMPAVETLGSVTVICADKTGTITKGEMTIRKLYSDDCFMDVSGIGYEPKGNFKPEGAIDKFSILIKAGLLCNDAELLREEDRWYIKGDPTEGSLIVLAAKVGLNLDEVKQNNPRIDEIPFSSERKLMTTVNNMADNGKTAFMKGAPEVVISRCSYESQKPLNENRINEILNTAETMAKDGLRVLALASKELEDGSEIEENMTFLGLVGMIDPPRNEAIEAVKVCERVKIRPVMITGDHKLTALAVAKKVGIYKEDDVILTGSELDNLPDEDFENIVEKVSVYARVSPLDKLKIVTAWKNKGHIVAMTGDGVNDAPALKHSDIGVAMGITGTEVTKEVADMILTDDNFATILKAIEMGRCIYDNIKKYLTYLLRANLIEVIVLGGIVIYMGPEYLPLLPAAILYVNLITDGLPAIALGVAPPEPDVMKRPPRNPNESVFSFDVKIFILAALVVVPLFFWVFLSHSENLLMARTELFYLFVLIELVMALNFNSLRYSLFKKPPDKWLVLSVILSIIVTFMLIQLPQIREVFGITFPTTEELWTVVAIAILVTITTELAKIYLSRRLT